MVILTRDEVIEGLISNLKKASDDQLVELYEGVYKFTPVIGEVVDEQHVQEAIWEDMRINVTCSIKDDIVEIIPDSFQELADYWEVEVNGDEFNTKLNELEDEWGEKVGRFIKIK